MTSRSRQPYARSSKTAHSPSGRGRARVSPAPLALGLVALLTVLGVAAFLVGRQSAPGTPATNAGPAAPDFTVRTFDGETFTLSEQQGKGVAVLFTAAWCSSCIPEVQKLNQLHEKYRSEGLEVLVLDVDPGETQADFEGFKQRAGGADYHWALDEGSRATLAYGVKATDTKVFIDRQGRVVETTQGPTEYGDLERAVREALQ